MWLGARVFLSLGHRHSLFYVFVGDLESGSFLNLACCIFFYLNNGRHTTLLTCFNEHPYPSRPVVELEVRSNIGSCTNHKRILLFKLCKSSLIHKTTSIHASIA